MVKEHTGFGAGEDQPDTVAVVRQPSQPARRGSAIGRIHPHHAAPRLAQTVVVDGVTVRRAGPRLRSRLAWIQVERSKRLDQPWRRDPAIGRLVRARVAWWGNCHGSAYTALTSYSYGVFTQAQRFEEFQTSRPSTLPFSVRFPAERCHGDQFLARERINSMPHKVNLLGELRAALDQVRR